MKVSFFPNYSSGTGGWESSSNITCSFQGDGAGRVKEPVTCVQHEDSVCCSGPNNSSLQKQTGSHSHFLLFQHGSLTPSLSLSLTLSPQPHFLWELYAAKPFKRLTSYSPFNLNRPTTLVIKLMLITLR